MAMAKATVLRLVAATVRDFGFGRLKGVAARGHEYELWTEFLTPIANAKQLERRLLRGEESALVAVLSALYQGGAKQAARTLAEAVLACPKLHSQASLVLEAAQQLITWPDESAFRAVLPFAFIRWAGGGVSLSESPFPRRVSVTLQYLQTNPPRYAAFRRWPKLGSRPLRDRIDADEDGDAIRVRQLVELIPAALDADRAALAVFVSQAFERAATPRMRYFSALGLARLGKHARLRPLVDDADWAIRRLAVELALQRNPRQAFATAAADPDPENRAHYIARLLVLDPRFAFERLGAELERDFTREDEKQLAPLFAALLETAEEAPRWHETEPRWVRALVAVQERYPDRFYDLTRILEKLPSRVVAAHSAPPTPPAIRPRSKPANEWRSWLARYEGGQYRKVWDEMRQRGEDMDRSEIAMARRVALATMQRVRRAARGLAQALEAEGYPLPNQIGLRARQSASTQRKLARLNRVGAIPVALASFYTIVGSINLVPEDLAARPILGLPIEELDPLEISGIDGAIEEYEAWRDEGIDSRSQRGELQVTICADRLGKAGLSGSGPLYIVLPSRDVDPLVEETRYTLIEYIRVALLERGGLLGLSPKRRGGKDLLRRLTSGIEEF